MTLPEETPPGQRYDGDHHPRKRASDHGWRYWAPWVYRHFVPAVAIAIAALALAQTQGKIDRQTEGRRIAIDVLCGGLVGVEEAGKKALTGRLAGQDPRGSLPPEAIHEYNATISHRVLLQAGVDARGVLQGDGTLNCDKLRSAAKAVSP